MNYRKVNNIAGWITGAFATLVYLMTMEPTVSFWDCGEFLSCGYKLEVGHSPGAPFFMLLQRMFAIPAGSNGALAVVFMNAWSAIASGLTILFLFWTITHFAKRLAAPGEEEPNSLQKLLIIGSGLVGALAYTFSDTFWFSAVEAEVYATSSLFTALVFWAALKWEHIADKPQADRWLVFIFFMMGLSIATHLLNLLTIPAVALLYYFKRYKTTTSGSIAAFLIGCAILAFIQFGLIQGLPFLAFEFDLIFVNSFGLPFDSGVITFLVLYVALLIGLLIYARKKGNYLFHLGMLCLIFVSIGYSTYLIPVLRSRADVPIDMTNPDNAHTFLSYVNREQFGQQPLLFGPDFDSPVENVKTTGYWYNQTTRNGKPVYEKVGEKLEYEYGKQRFFPRIWGGNDPSHVNFYREFLNLGPNESPTSADNFNYFFNYQINWMWWRYFMWNYAGRQNDFQGHRGPKDGNWISGIKPIDKMMGRGDIDLLPDGYRNNKARNELYFLPFLLGLAGLVYQFNRNKKDGIITFMLFFFTGIAIAIYLNMTPLQPRERDYAFAGSTYAYAIWIGLGVLMVHEWLRKYVKGASGAYLAIVLCLVAVPALMAKEEWDDHDRSKKTLALATAKNTLNSCAPNAILFTFGDNDTYPLWYAQEVEGIRTDVRIVNTSLLGISWYIDQLNYQINDAPPVPMLWKQEDYVGSRRNYLRYFDNPQIPKDRYFNLMEVCQFITSNDPVNKLRTSSGETENYLPSKNLFVPGLSVDELIKLGMLNPQDSNNIVNDMRFSLPKDVIYKDDIAILQIVAAVAKDGWKRPIYFGSGGRSADYQGMQDYLKAEGTALRLVPYKKAPTQRIIPNEIGFVDVDRSYDLFMNHYTFGGAERNDVYFDEKNRQMLISYRVAASRLADELTVLGRQKEAIEVLDKVVNGISEASYAYDAPTYLLVTSYYRAGAKDKGATLAAKLCRNLEDNINYILSLNNPNVIESFSFDVQQGISIMNLISTVAAEASDTATANTLSDKVQKIIARASGKVTFR
jgi:hypothetical protein